VIRISIVAKLLVVNPVARQPSVPDALPLRQVLAECEPLQRLQQRLAQAQARMDAVRPLLPPGLSAHVRSGPVDPEAWTLLASNAAVAAKLRHCLPRLVAELKRRGLQPYELKVRVLAGQRR
jgi:hypothetical protein